MATVQNVMRTRRCAHAPRKRTHTIMYTCAHAKRRSHRDLRGLTAIRESTIKIESYALIGKSSVNARAVRRMHTRAHDRTHACTQTHRRARSHAVAHCWVRHRRMARPTVAMEQYAA